MVYPDGNANSQNKGTHRCNLVPCLEAMTQIVSMCPTRLADHSQIMHGEKGDVETYEHEGEHDFSDLLIHKPPGHFREPKVKA